MMAPFRIAVLAGALVTLVTACGSDGGGAPSAAELAKGKKVFVSSCGGCHTLSAAGTKGVSGGPLEGLSFSESFVKQRVHDGGGGMPAFAHELSSDEIEAVSAFVADATR
jgi:mono/diheme cytochrome c family protein